MAPAAAAPPLSGIRVLDLTTARGEIAGKILADLGAEVLKIEPPEGCDSRRMPPFEDGREGDPDGSLYWAAYGRGKRSITLDLASAAGRQQLRTLAEGADILLESFEPGRLAGLGLGYEDLRALNPALVYASITPFGQSGPDAHSPATDLTVEAAGGLLSLTGDGDRPPVPVGYPQAGLHGGAQAAADAVVALVERDRSGLGQHLDVSMQACMVWTLMDASGFPPNTGRDKPGFGDDRAAPPPQRVPGLELRHMIEAVDGHTLVTMGVNRPQLTAVNETMKWLREDGVELPEHLQWIDWEHWQEDFLDPAVVPEHTHQVSEAIQLAVAFLRTKTKRELHERAVASGALYALIATAVDLLADRQLEDRGYWTEIGGQSHPGPFARLSRTPLRVKRPAPALGEANALSGEPREPASPARAGGAAHGRRVRPFEGVKVADFSWFGVGPLIAKGLADHGATVVHVESENRLDMLRMAPPFKDGIRDVNRSQFFADFNSSKLGITLDLASEGGRSLARKLAGWADVVIESFTPGTMERHGLDWETLREGRRDLVMLRTCMRGQTGPEAAYTGFGMQGSALSGLHGVTGWPDRAPCGPHGAYTDFINPRFGLAAVAAALHERTRSGEGQLIDLSQVEAAIHFVAPLVLDYAVNGRVAPPAGHDSRTACPHGVYAVGGVERYIAIACETAEQWRALRDLAGLEGFGGTELDSFEGRRAARERIDEALRAWCAGEDGHALAAWLKAAGVPASAVLRPSDLYADAQLAHRGFFVTMEHPVMGPTPYDGLATIFSETPGVLSKAAPLLGEDTHYVLTELLGVSADELAEFAAAGALT